MKLRTLRFSFSILAIILMCQSVSAAPWETHQAEIEDLERSVYKLQQELEFLVERKKNTRERVRIEQTLQRIVEINAELISLRKTMDTTRTHLEAEHPEQAGILDEYDSRMFAFRKKNRKYNSPISKQLDSLLLKVQLKFASFVTTDDRRTQVREVENVLKKKRKQKKEREADIYLRRRSKIKLVK